ncbi:O-antigen ligase family protein [Candidatus Saccharibacteria bacterium]|nr:O-antigen ligase family protein [Candidatus Saccharibacteria bacterium]
MLSLAQRARFVYYLIVVLLIGLPFHAVIVTVLNDFLPAESLLRAWKEVVLLLAAIVSITLIKPKEQIKDKLLIMILVYAVLHIVYGVATWSGLSTFVGLRTNLSFLVIFVVGYFLSPKLKEPQIDLLYKIALIMGGLVAISALAQLVLPAGWFNFDLVGIGGDVSKIQDSSISRLHGLMSGPLQLGSYLVLPFALGLVRLRGWHRVSYSALVLIAILLSYSRAALVAAGAAMAVLMVFNYRHKLSRRLVIGGATAVLVFGAGVLVLALQWRPLSLLVFHAEPGKALSESSTADHFEYSFEAAKDLAEDPLGDGPGTAGPASAFSGEERITENYFLQIGLEVGVVGMLVFIDITFLVAKKLFDQKNATLLASFVGINLMNLLLHTWTDTATAWTWWLLAGVSLGQIALSKPLKRSRRVTS